MKTPQYQEVKFKSQLDNALVLSQTYLGGTTEAG
jgi:hypothetical protein